jgi:hypothetical protein
MSLNRALGELFKAIREEAARNPEFAARLGDAIAIYKPPKRRRSPPAPAPAPPPAQPFDLAGALARPAGDAGDDEAADASGFGARAAGAPGSDAPGSDAPGSGASGSGASGSGASRPEAARPHTPTLATLRPEPRHGAAPALNPISFLSREGEEALRRELAGAGFSREGLERLVAEHNLDPAGLAAGADKSALIEQIVSGAKKRVARDKALFDY